MSNRQARRRAEAQKRKLAKAAFKVNGQQAEAVLPEAVQARREAMQEAQSEVQLLEAFIEYAGRHAHSLDVLLTLHNEGVEQDNDLELDEESSEALESGLIESKIRLMALHAKLAEALDRMISLSFPSKLLDEATLETAPAEDELEAADVSSFVTAV